MRKVNKEKERGVDTYVHGSIYNCKKKKTNYPGSARNKSSVGNILGMLI